MATRDSYAGDPVAGNVLTAANFKKLPGGWIGFDEATTDAVTSGTTELTVHTLSVPIDQNRKVKVTFHCLRFTCSVANDFFSLRIKWGAGPTQVGEMRMNMQHATNYPLGDFSATFDQTGAAANFTVVVTAVRTGGTGTLTMAGTTGGASRWMLVEDIGPNS